MVLCNFGGSCLYGFDFGPVIDSLFRSLWIFPLLAMLAHSVFHCLLSCSCLLLDFLWRFVFMVGVALNSHCCRLPCRFWGLVYLSFALYRPMLGVAGRHGEALNPGPHATFRFCITNPTCVNRKFDSYHDLVRQHSCDLISMSETAATEVVQRQFSAKFISKKCKVLWSPPVMPLTETSSGCEHSREKPLGLPCWRLSRVVLLGCLSVKTLRCPPDSSMLLRNWQIPISKLLFCIAGLFPVRGLWISIVVCFVWRIPNCVCCRCLLSLWGIST